MALIENPKDSIPELQKIAGDLLHVSKLRTVLILLSPIVALALYFFLAHGYGWPAALMALAAFQFFSYGSTCHELVHGNLPIPTWTERFFLSLIELLALRSGTAYRISHLFHHSRFPDSEDVEGSPAQGSFWQALLSGPFYQIRIWLFAWRISPRERLALFVEAGMVLGLWTLGISLWESFPQLLIYEVLVTTSSWLFPLFLVYLQHDAHGTSPLRQTRLYRNKWLAILTFQHLYHLEHHLYPRVPHPHWPQLARRLDPYFAQAGLKPTHWF